MRQYESFGEYTEEVCAQVRLRQARPEIEAELLCHMEEQAQHYREEGIPQKEAMQKAIEDMGDPVMTGGQLDATHRPKADKRLLLFAGLMIAVAVVMQLLVSRYNPSMYLYLAVGVGVCLAIYYVDYTILPRYVWIFYAGVIVSQICFALYTFNARNYPIAISWFSLLLVPVFCGILFNMRGKGKTGVGISVAAMWGALFVLVLIPNFSMAFTVGLCCFVLHIWAILSGWFGGKKYVAMLITILPIALFVMSYIALRPAEYQLAWLASIFVPEESANGFYVNMMRDVMQGVQAVGSSTTLDAQVWQNPVFDTGMSLFYIIALHGVLLAAAIIAVMAGMCFFMFRIASVQKNSFARMLATGCALVYTVQCACFVLSNMVGMDGLFYSQFPFSSGSTIVVNMIILGIFLSACKWNGIVSEKTLFAKRQRVKT